MFKAIKTPEQVAFEEQSAKDQARIAELKALLADTDFKTLPDYDKPNEDIKVQRQAWREEVRILEDQNQLDTKFADANP